MICLSLIALQYIVVSSSCIQLQFHQYIMQQFFFQCNCSVQLIISPYSSLFTSNLAQVLVMCLCELYSEIYQVYVQCLVYCTKSCSVQMMCKYELVLSYPLRFPLSFNSDNNRCCLREKDPLNFTCMDGINGQQQLQRSKMHTKCLRNKNLLESQSQFTNF